MAQPRPQKPIDPTPAPEPVPSAPVDAADGSPVAGDPVPTAPAPAPEPTPAIAPEPEMAPAITEPTPVITEAAPAVAEPTPAIAQDGAAKPAQFVPAPEDGSCPEGHEVRWVDHVEEIVHGDGRIERRNVQSLGMVPNGDGTIEKLG